MDNEQRIQSIKLAALDKVSRLGLTPGEVGAMLRKTMQGETTKLAWPSPVTEASNVLSLLKDTALLSVLLSGGLGAGLGYLGEQTFGTNAQDVSEAREKQRIDRLRRATIRMNAETDSTRDNENATKPRRQKPQALEILSAVGSSSDS